MNHIAPDLPAEDHPDTHIRGIMLPSGDVLFTDDASPTCPWCELVDMQGCFMHLTCGQGAVRGKPKHKKTASQKSSESG